jgi:hypothetical protein
MGPGCCRRCLGPCTTFRIAPLCPWPPGPARHVLQRASASAVNQLLMPGAPLACGPGVLQQVMPPSFKPSSLDNLLCFGHYVVHQVCVLKY